MKYFYNPATGEHIETGQPADWMGSTDATPPAFDSATQSAFFQNGTWVVVTGIAPDQSASIAARLTQLRAVREEILNRLGGIAGRADRKGDKATADACDAATQSLLDITKDLPADLDAIELEVITRYKTIVTTAAITAPSLVSAFVGVDL